MESTDPAEPKQPKPLVPLFSIWFHPRKTVRQIVETNPSSSVLLIAFLYGGIQSLIQGIETAAEKGLPAQMAAAVSFFVGGIIGIIILYCVAWLYSWIGHWLGGDADSGDLRAACAWSEIPSFPIFAVWFLTFFGPKIGFFPKREFTELAYPLTLAIFSIWSAVLACHTVGEVNHFSAWKGLLTLLIPALAVLIPMGIFVVSAVGLPAVTHYFKQRGGVITDFFEEKGKAIQWKGAPKAVPVTTVDETGQKTEPISIDFEELRLTKEAVRLELKGGTTLDVRILEEEGPHLYVDTAHGIANIAKSDIMGIERRQKSVSQ